jgi:RNA polymerase sigma factor (sigma-70 family)
MAPAARPGHLPEFALKLVRARARELSRQRIIPAYERTDIEQHFLLELWRRWRRFDGSRGGLPGFVVRVIDNSAADLISRHAPPGRVYPLQFVSIHEVVCHDGDDIGTVDDAVSEDQALWQVPSNQFDAAELRVDLGRAVACLPSRLQGLCRRLSSRSIAQIARETTTSRGSVYRSVATIRQCFLEAGLHLYLADAPAFARSAR